MNPIYKNIINLNIPDNLNYNLIYIDNVVFLESNALFQPSIVLFPDLKIDSHRWVYYNKIQRKLYEMNNNKITVLEDNSRVEVDNIYYVNVGGTIEKIIERNGEYVYNGESYSKQIIDEEKNVLLLSNKKKIIVFWNRTKIEYDKPDFVSFNNNTISLIYDTYTEIVTRESNFKLNKKAIYLGKIWGKHLIKTFDGKLYLEGEPIGICKEKTELLGYNSSLFLLKCGNTVKYFRENIWKTLNIGRLVNGAFVNDNFVILRTESNTIVYDREFKPIYFLNKSKDAVANSKYIFLLSSKTFGIIDFLENGEIIKVEKSSIDFNTPLVVYVRKFYNPTFIDMDVIRMSEKDDKFVKYYVEPKVLGNKVGRIKLDSPFYNTIESIRIESTEPQLDVTGEIVKSNGYVLNTNKNSLLNIRIYGKIQTFLPYKLRIIFRNSIFEYNFSEKLLDINLKIPVNIFDDKLSNEVVYLELIKSNSIQLKEEILLPVRYEYPDSNQWKKHVIRPNNDNVIKILYQKTDDLEWRKTFVYPTYKKGIIVKFEGESVKIGNKTFKVKKGVHIMENYVIIGIDNNIIPYLIVKIDFPYLLVIPDIKDKYPLEVFYSTHVYRGFPAKVAFPIDPAYNKIVLRVYIGKDIMEKTFVLPREIFLKIGMSQAAKISEYLKSIGIL